MQVPIINGIYTDGGAPDFRTSYPRNLIPVPKTQGISSGYLRPADGVKQTGTGPGADRGGINWNGLLYRVMGSSLVRVETNQLISVLGDVGPGGPVAMDYGFDRLAIASGGRLYYWNNSTLVQVTDPDLGICLDVKFMFGYFMTTDGTSLVVTDLTDPTSVNPLHYGSAEADPDPIQGVDLLRSEAYAFGRYTIQPFDNVGGSGFPFSPITSAVVPKGIIGGQAYCPLGDTFAFVGSGRGEAPAVYTMVPGNTVKVSTREIDRLLLNYTEDQLAGIVMETRVDKNHQHVYIHLPDQCLVYDTIGSQAVGEPVWFTLASSIVGDSRYLARGLVWCYNAWNVGDPVNGRIGQLTDEVATHYGDTVGHSFGTQVFFNAAAGAIVHELELVCLTGRVALGADPVIWTQYTLDGVTWSQQKSTRAGRQGQRAQRICWRNQGAMQLWRAQRFRWTSDAHISVARLEIQAEPLFTKGFGNG